MNIADGLTDLLHPVADLHELPGNPRRGDVEAVKASYERFGQRKPIVVRTDDTGKVVVVAGNHQLKAVRELGWEQVAVVWADDLTEDEATAFALADNRVADLGSYDDADLLAMIDTITYDPDLLAATGYNAQDLDKMLALTSDESDDTDKDVDAVPAQAPAKTVKGDVWLLGPHRIMCGDSSSPTDVDKLMNGHAINLAFTSPPYAQQREYDKSSGFRPIPPDEYVAWFQPIAANVAANLADDGSWFVNIRASADGIDRSLYVMDLVVAHVRQWGWHFAEEYCWERTGVPKRPAMRFKNQWEPIYQFVHERWKFRPDNVRHPSDDAITPVGVGAGNTNWANKQGNGPLFDPKQLSKKRKSNAERQGDPDDDWFSDQYVSGFAYPGNRLPTFMGSHEATGHTAAFPVGLPEWFVKAYTDEGDNVYDPFMGSGSTLLAAHQQQRVGFGMELSPGYVDIICRRFQEHTGIKPINEATGNEHDFTVG